MKKFLVLLGLVAAAAQAQTFEGIVRWKMSMEITDPAMKAQMAEAEKKMKDPETQKQMKEMEAKMNDPEMKKMMDQNPQMKAAMENQMKMMKGGGGGMDGMMPKGMMIKVKGANLITLVEGGMADGMEMLHLKDQAPVRINRKDMTYSKMSQVSGAPAPEAKVTKTSETMKVLGYTCTKYVVEMTERGRQVTQTMWTTTDIKDMDFKALAKQRMGQGGQSWFSDKVDGVPLRMEMTSPQGNMLMEVTEIKRETLSDADFVIPAGFKEVKGSGF